MPLRIIANKTGNQITSARIKSDIDDLDAYGYYEVRASSPSESGAWPAIWLLGDDTADRPWPDTGEIDLVEEFSNYFDEVSGNLITTPCTLEVPPISRRPTEIPTSSGRATSVPQSMSGTPTRCGGP